METVPNEIKYIPVEAQKQKTEQRAVENLFACRYLSVYKICNAEYSSQKPAINIRKTVSVSYMNSRQKIPETFNECLIGRKRCRKTASHVGVVLHGEECRHKHKRRKSATERGERDDFRRCSEELFRTLVFRIREVHNGVVANDENADHKPDIVIRVHYESEHYRIEQEFALVYKPVESENAKRQKHNDIKPHRAPRIAHIERAHSVHHRKKKRRHIVSVKRLFEIYEHKR